MEPIDDETRSQIFSLWSRAVGSRTIARTYELPRQVIEDVIEAEKRKEPNPFDEDPIGVVRDHYIRIDALREEVARLISREKTGSTRARALALQFQLNEHRLGLSQAIGTLPSPESFRPWADGIQLANRMLDLLEAKGLLDVEMMDAIAEEFPTTRELSDHTDESA